MKKTLILLSTILIVIATATTTLAATVQALVWKGSQAIIACEVNNKTYLDELAARPEYVGKVEIISLPVYNNISQFDAAQLAALKASAKAKLNPAEIRALGL